MKDDSETNIRKNPVLVVSTQEVYDSVMQTTVIPCF